MKLEDRKMRLTLRPLEVEHMAQLRAYYSRLSNRSVTANEVLRSALSHLHSEIFSEKGNPIPEEWPAYDR